MRPLEIPTFEHYLERGHPSSHHDARTATEPSPEAPLVSIVTPVRNGRRHVQSALESVQAQTYANVEHLVLDGGSNDGTQDILSSSTVDYWHSQPDRGMYDAINHGIALARGELIKILNADDVLPPDSVGRAVAAYRDLGASDVLIRSELDVIDDQGTVLSRTHPAHSAPIRPRILHPSWYLPRRTYERHGLYALNYRISADNEMNWRLHRAGIPVHHLDEPLVRFRMGGMSSTVHIFPESFDVHRRYVGILGASVIVGTAMLLGAGRNVVAPFIGEQRARRMARRVRMWRYRARQR